MSITLSSATRTPYIFNRVSSRLASKASGLDRFLAKENPMVAVAAKSTIRSFSVQQPGKEVPFQQSSQRPAYQMRRLQNQNKQDSGQYNTYSYREEKIFISTAVGITIGLCLAVKDM